MEEHQRAQEYVSNEKRKRDAKREPRTPSEIFRDYLAQDSLMDDSKNAMYAQDIDVDCAD